MVRNCAVSLTLLSILLYSSFSYAAIKDSQAEEKVFLSSNAKDSVGTNFDDDVDGDDSPSKNKDVRDGGCGQYHPGWEDLIEDLPGAPPHSFRFKPNPLIS